MSLTLLTHTTEARTNMLKQQCRTWGIVNPMILDLLEKTPRENFVPKRYQHLAFADIPLPLEHEQFMLTPREEAKIIDLLNIQPHERILEIGTGSGYFTALLAQLAQHVTSIDIYKSFSESAAQKLHAQHIHNITLKTGDGLAPEKNPVHYDAIILTGSLIKLPQHFMSYLNNRGRLFAFLGKSPIMQATLMTHKNVIHKNENLFEQAALFDAYVKPLSNTHCSEQFIF